MPGEYSHKHAVTVHAGPMADKRGTGWREDAAKLEEANERRIENPMKTPPNNLTSIDKAHTHGAKSDEGTFEQSDVTIGGDDVKIHGVDVKVRGDDVTLK